MKKKQSLYYTAAPVKFSLLSLCSFGLYEFYWFYENWKLYKTQTERWIVPSWRATVVPIYAYAMFKFVGDRADENDVPMTIHPGWFAAAYIVLWTLTVLPSPWNLLKLFTFVPVLMVNNVARRVCAVADPDFVDNVRLGFLNIMVVFFGGLGLIGMLGMTYLSQSGYFERYIEQTSYANLLSSRLQQ